ncbi:DNA polymerase III subunit beta [Virgibacillus halodenitrificans]|uniref:DNA polymerase III subunit beta n=1 Tax=Virgibacillus halodenitrificans TaxID=1482 RepID=UPI000EF46E86|nr:DNA polymerase III subunit beta [Virgibacillus halodenitrificans]
MKLTINKDVLVNALTKVEKAAGKSQIPALQGIYFEATEEKLRFIGANDEQVITVDVPVDENVTVNKAGRSVFTKGITDIAKKLADETVSIETDDSNLQYHIKSKLSNFSFSGYDPKEFPKFDEPAEEEILELSFDELRDYVGKLSFASSTEDTRPILQGIHVSSKEGQLKLVSTNSHILSQKVVAKETKGEIAITPKAKSLSDSLRVFDANDTIKVYATSTHLILKSNDVMVRNRLLDGNFPQTERLVVTQFKAIMEVDKKQLITALEQVQIVGHGSKTMPNAAALSISGENIKIENNFTESGKAEIEIPLVELQKNDEMVDIKFSFNVKYMIDLVKATDGNIRIAFVDSMRPVSILGAEANGEYKLILPIRTR